MTPEAIKPCPFCAQKPQLKGKRLIHNSKLCFFKLDLEGASPEQVVDEWNRRPGENKYALSIIKHAVWEVQDSAKSNPDANVVITGTVCTKLIQTVRRKLEGGK